MAQVVDDELSMAQARSAHVVDVPYQSVTSFFMGNVLFAVPVVCFIGALLTDLRYVRDPDYQWTNFSSWLLAFGILFLGLSILASLIRYVSTMRTTRRPVSWLAGLILVLAFAAGLYDNFIHSHDGWTSVWPVGLATTAITVALLVIAMVIKLSALSNVYLVDAS
jgi:uncharacterized membrane protein